MSKARLDRIHEAFIGPPGQQHLSLHPALQCQLRQPPDLRARVGMRIVRMGDIKAVRTLQQRFPAGLIFPGKRPLALTRSDAHLMPQGAQSVGYPAARFPGAANDDDRRFLAHAYPLLVRERGTMRIFCAS